MDFVSGEVHRDYRCFCELSRVNFVGTSTMKKIMSFVINHLPENVTLKNQTHVSLSFSSFLPSAFSFSLQVSNCIFRNLSKCRRGIILKAGVYFGPGHPRVRPRIVVGRPPTRAARLGLFRSLRPQQLSDNRTVTAVRSLHSRHSRVSGTAVASHRERHRRRWVALSPTLTRRLTTDTHTHTQWEMIIDTYPSGLIVEP